MLVYPGAQHIIANSLIDFVKDSAFWMVDRQS
jgi:hypothetical protein